MNELTGSPADVVPDQLSAGSQLSAGGMLRRAREDAGLHIGALAVTLKVPVKKLEALEADRLDLLPDAVFARALAATVCRILRVDPAPVLLAFPKTNGRIDSAERTANQMAYRPRGQGSKSSLAQWLSRPLMLLGFAFAIGAVVLLFFPVIQQLIADVRKGAESSSPPPVLSASIPDTLTPNVTNSNAAPANAQSGSAMGLNSTDAGARAALGSAAADVVVNAPTGPESVPAAIAAPEVLRLTARGSSWVEVLDSKQAVVLRKTMVSGESQNLGGLLPLTVVLGRSNLIDVEVRGKVLDLVTLTKDNVARFEVK